MMEKEKILQALKLFVGNDELRPLLNQAFKQDGYYYSTDAHSMMRVDGSFDLEISEQDKPNAGAVIKQAKTHEPIEIIISELDAHLTEITPKVPDEKDCYACNGVGYEECDLGHEHECDICNGDGSQVIDPIKMVTDKWAKYKFFNGVMARTQIIKVINACKILGIEKINKISGEGNRQYQFSADNILFLCMPVINDTTDEVIKTKYL